MSNDKKGENIKVSDEGDEELSQLLDSALKDFSKEEVKPTPTLEEKKDTETGNEWSDEFVRQAAEQFESDMANLLKESGACANVTSDQVQQSFQQMAAAAAAAVSNTHEGQPDSDFSASITQALKGLTEGTENLQNPFTEADLMSMFGQSAEGDQNAFDVLYPSLKDILNKYPAWMEANGGSLRVPIDNGMKTARINDRSLCSVEKNQTVTLRVIRKLLQDYGQPPTDLVGDLGPSIPFDAQGNPNLNQCSLM
ncbi:hypothetical protein RI129_012403 [Pyrocoelia pectoralis]|uniref:Peroxin-19 n=1 Tax=Pyrocoelia pectoralis TaxID=417401 RepID=A0AAN7ZFV6_9COLE